MSISTVPRPPVHAAFAAFIDYAGLFPPAKLPLAEAAAEYAAARSGRHAWMLGRFIMPASLLRHPERSEPEASEVEGPLSVIVDADPDPRQWFASAQRKLEMIAALREQGVPIETLEVPLPALSAQRDTYDGPVGQLGALLDRFGLRGLPVCAELPRIRSLDSARDDDAVLARVGIGAKLRCGGVTAEAFPSVDDVAAWIASAVEAKVPFKATAGLHHPVRHLDAASGFVMHGFLNILAAAAFARDVDRDTLRQIVAEEEPDAFTFDDALFGWRDESVPADALVTVRKDTFVGYGSCSFNEPVDDLIALGVLAKP